MNRIISGINITRDIQQLNARLVHICISYIVPLIFSGTLSRLELLYLLDLSNIG